MAKASKLPTMAPGQRYERLTSIGFDHRGQRNAAFWLFRCDCGEEIVKKAAHVKRGAIKSCGCFRRDFGSTIGSLSKHGMSQTPEYRSWNRMLDRCRNKNSDAFGYYGGRGILVCERWLDFTNFYSDMGRRPKGHSLDRINNDGNYEPANCRWATNSQQASNRRKPAKSL